MRWLRRLGYATLAAAVLLLFLTWLVSPIVFNQPDDHFTDATFTDATSPEATPIIEVNGTHKVGSPVNVSVTAKNHHNTSASAEWLIVLFERKYNVARTAESVSINASAKETVTKNVSLSPPMHHGNHTIIVESGYGETLATEDFYVRCNPNASADSDVPEELREYEIPDYIDIHRLQPADDRVPVNDTIALELNVTNECNQAVTFNPPLFAYDKLEDVRMGAHSPNVTMQGGETIHDEIVVLRPDREADVWIGIDYDGERYSVGHVEVYNSTATEVENR